MDRPLGIADIGGVMDYPKLKDGTDTWYWCRYHEQAIHANKMCKGAGGYLPTGDLPGDGCIRIGPFMSEAEANRLARHVTTHPVHGCWTDYGPLGRKVET